MVRRSRKNSRSEILRVFARLVADRGYSDSSIGNVADELQLSKGTVAFHFGSKAALMDLVIVAYMKRRLDEAHHVLASLSTPAEQLTAMIYALLASHRDDRDATRAFLREFTRFTDSDDHKELRGLRDTYTGIVRGIIRRGMDQGHFRHDDSTLVTLQIFGMCNYAWTWYDPKGSQTCQGIASTFTRTVLAGLCDPATGTIRPEEIERMVTQAREVVESARNRFVPYLASPSKRVLPRVESMQEDARLQRYYRTRVQPKTPHGHI